MAKDVKVLLLEDIQSLGRAGDIVTVTDGFARNKLFPEGKAALATEQVTAAHKKAQAQQSQAKNTELTALRSQAEKFEGTELTIEAKVNEGDDIFGSVTNKDIAKTLTAAGLATNDKQITADTPIKKLGTYDIQISLSPEVEFAMKLVVTPDAASRIAKQGDQDE